MPYIMYFTYHTLEAVILTHIINILFSSYLPNQQPFTYLQFYSQW